LKRLAGRYFLWGVSRDIAITERMTLGVQINDTTCYSENARFITVVIIVMDIYEVV